MNTKKLFFILVFILTVFSAKAQFTITGQVRDTVNEPIASATVMLLSPKDTSLVNFTTSDSKGNFSFRNIRKANYIFKVSHVSYMPREIFIQPTEEREMNLGVIEMKPIANFLLEVVIRDARAPIFIKGDTVEYDATTFKVPPGSTIEDLLRRLPGIDVDADGNISTMGRDVKTVYVDGKAFFGNSPKTVTQNLDAAAVSKVQIYTEKSEQEKITGIADGSKEKVMNVELKDEYKKGYFGKASAGYGWGAGAPHRWVAKGNFNWFTDKQQLSFIGYGNNLNQSGMDWSDRSEFYGQSMQTGNDNGDFGFGSSTRRFFQFTSYSYGGSEGGFSNNGGGGVNYNYYNKKVKFNAGYFYTVNKTWSDVFSERQTFLEDSTFWRIDTTRNDNLRQNHSFSTRFEYEIDSCNNIVVRANFNYAPINRIYKTDQFFQTSEFLPINLHKVDNKYLNDDLNFDILTIYNHKFKKKGRVFAMSGFYNYKDGNNLEDINNFNEFFNAATVSDQIKFMVKNNKNSEDHNVKSSVLYVEPLGKRFSLLGFYNFRNTLSRNHNTSTDPQNSIEIDSLWVKYRNHTLYNRVGTSVNYAHNGINLTMGGAFQSLVIDGTCETKPQAIENLAPTPYNNFIPYLAAFLQLPKNVYAEATYSFDVNAPDVSYLFPMPNLSNTMYKVLGNPNLTPERYHEIDGRVSYWNSASMINASISANAKFYASQIVYNQITEFIEHQGFVTTSTPDNVNGGNNFSSHLWASLPIVKTKLTMSINGGGRLSNSPMFINDIENITNSKSYWANLGLTLTLGQRLSFSPWGSVSQTFTQYSIQTDRNQSFINYGASLTAKWQVFKKTYLEGTYWFSNYTNKNLDFNQNIHRLNLSVRQVIGKKNQWELRLAAVDILNQNEYIRQIAAVNYIEYRVSPTLARYFLLTVSYNLRGFEVKNSGNQRVRVMQR
ncbi:MAG: outer membrane beta-barrel protein [Bacteroidetes bacterium]|nr:outer membrane beta-barrel protein [Bacteroidota bacterium]MCL2303149.1 outer membrane beta-barrel protein [Lentimicrobiaceae bacterium]